MKKMKEKMAPSKKMMKPAKKVAQRKYVEDDEEYEDKMSKKRSGKKKPADIGQALNQAKMGYSKKPRVKPSKKKGMKAY